MEALTRLSQVHAPESFVAAKSKAMPDRLNRKRSNSIPLSPEPSHKRPRLHVGQPSARTKQTRLLSSGRAESRSEAGSERDQLPSPPRSKEQPGVPRSKERPGIPSIRDSITSLPTDNTAALKRKLRSFSESDKGQSSLAVDKPDSRRPYTAGSIGNSGTDPISYWVDNQKWPDEYSTMDINRPPTKRSRSSTSNNLERSSSGPESQTTPSKGSKSAYYLKNGYIAILETKGCFMYDSKAGISDPDKDICQRLLDSHQVPPSDTVFEDKYFTEFQRLISDRSEASVFMQLSPLVFPSVVDLYVRGRRALKDLIQGNNDSWNRSIPFFGPRPQPDHTVGYRVTSFDDVQLRKLRIQQSDSTHYAARDDIYFPFLTCEVKGSQQSLDIADRQNMHSMAVAVRGVVELYKQVQRQDELHRRNLAFSISHDHRNVYIYGHYADQNGNDIAYYRHQIQEIRLSDPKDRWIAYKFVCNVYEHFAPLHLQRLKEIIDQLSDPGTESIRSSTTATNYSEFQGSQDTTTNEASSQEIGSFRKPNLRKAGAVDLVERQKMIQLQQQLQQQVEQQQQELEKAKQQREEDKRQRERLQQTVDQLLEKEGLGARNS